MKVGIIGAGIRGQLFARALARTSGVSVVGLAEPMPDVARTASRATGIPVVPGHTELFEQHTPDAVVIATPDFAHRDAAVDAAAAGCHILLEKPVATTVADAYAIRDAVTAAGVECLVGFENRWNPHLLQARRAIERGELGDVLTQRVSLSNTYFVPTTMLSWADRSSPGWFLMPHTVDLVTWLSGRRPVSVTGYGSRGVLAARGVDTWDVIHALVRFDDGTTANLTSCWVLPDTSPGVVQFGVEVVGSGGMVRADLDRQGLTIATDAYRSVWPVDGEIGVDLVGAPVWMARSFVRQVRDGVPAGPTIHDGTLVTEVVAAIHESLDTGQPVSLGAAAGEAAPAGRTR